MSSPMESEPDRPDRIPADPERWSPPLPPSPGRAPRRRLPPSINALFFLLTLATTDVAGALLTLDDLSFRTAIDVILTPSLWSLGFPYAFTLILILGAHEMGHYVACRIYGIDATLPFFIPAPPIPIGTFGAVI